MHRPVAARFLRNIPGAKIVCTAMRGRRAKARYVKREAGEGKRETSDVKREGYKVKRNTRNDVESRVTRCLTCYVLRTD